MNNNNLKTQWHFFWWLDGFKIKSYTIRTHARKHSGRNIFIVSDGSIQHWKFNNKIYPSISVVKEAVAPAAVAAAAAILILYLNSCYFFGLTNFLDINFIPNRRSVSWMKEKWKYRGKQRHIRIRICTRTHRDRDRLYEKKRKKIYIAQCL